MTPELIKSCLKKFIDEIDAGNSYLTEEEERRVVDAVKRYFRKNNEWNKYQSYTFLNMSRASFDKKVREGKIPKGKKNTCMDPPIPLWKPVRRAKISLINQ